MTPFKNQKQFWTDRCHVCYPCKETCTSSYGHQYHACYPENIVIVESLPVVAGGKVGVRIHDASCKQDRNTCDKGYYCRTNKK